MKLIKQKAMLCIFERVFASWRKKQNIHHSFYSVPLHLNSHDRKRTHTHSTRKRTYTRSEQQNVLSIRLISSLSLAFCGFFSL